MLNLIPNKKYEPYTNSNTKTQSAVCILCRGKFITSDPKLDSTHPQQAKFQEQKDIEILYIQRQHSNRDQYSGEIAFPGGKCDDNETDLQAVIREVYEEIGLDLNQLETYYVARLPGNAFMRKTRQNTSLYCTAFVLAINDPNKITDNLTLSQNEVRSFKWVPISYFDNPILTTKKSKHYFGPKAIAKYFKGAETAALDIGLDEVLYGFTFFMTITFLCQIAKHQKLWNHGHYAKFTFTGPMKYALEFGAMITYKRERIALFDPWNWPIFTYMIPLFILFLFVI